MRESRFLLLTSERSERLLGLPLKMLELFSLSDTGDSKMTPEIKPALTREEWESNKWSAVVRLNQTEVYGDRLRHAVAALALQGQPFGFTREDVNALRGLARM